MTWPANWTVNSANSVRFLYRRPVVPSRNHGLRTVINKGIDYGPGNTGPFVFAASSWEGKLRLGAANVAGADVIAGISLTSCGIGGFCGIIPIGDLIIGATLVKGTDYYLARTPGKITTHDLLVSGDKVVRLFNAKSTTVGVVKIDNTQVTL